jgi:hypothetical protein
VLAVASRSINQLLKMRQATNLENERTESAARVVFSHLDQTGAMQNTRVEKGEDMAELRCLTNAGVIPAGFIYQAGVKGQIADYEQALYPKRLIMSRPEIV